MMQNVCGLKTNVQGACVFVTPDYCKSVCNEPKAKCKKFMTEDKRRILRDRAEKEALTWQ